MNVAKNVGYGLKMHKVPQPEIDERVNEALELVKLGGYNSRRVTQLSRRRAAARGTGPRACSPSRTFSCWTSRSPRSTARYAPRCSMRSAISSGRSARRPCSLRTIRRKRSRCPTRSSSSTTARSSSRATPSRSTASRRPCSRPTFSARRTSSPAFSRVRTVCGAYAAKTSAFRSTTSAAGRATPSRRRCAASISSSARRRRRARTRSISKRRSSPVFRGSSSARWVRSRSIFPRSDPRRNALGGRRSLRPHPPGERGLLQ